MRGVIIAAGYGTRFLPVTKTVPKVLVGTKPSIAYIVDEFLASGIDEIVVVSSRRKKALEDYFDREIELEEVFRREGRAYKLALVAASRARVSFVRQAEMRGTGHALLQAKSLLCGEPCVVAYPDDLHVGTPPLSRQLIDLYEETGKSVLYRPRAGGRVPLRGRRARAHGVSVSSFVEKPAKGTEPSHEVHWPLPLYARIFFDLVEEGWRKHGAGEYFHAYAIDSSRRAKSPSSGPPASGSIPGIRRAISRRS